VTSSPDTTAEAEAAQVQALRRMGPARRSALAVEMSESARNLCLTGIRHRHPEYDDATARWALFRLLIGDELFQRVWPQAPVVAP
jgi:hypothetical protein